jgi:hypothetical protein
MRARAGQKERETNAQSEGERGKREGEWGVEAGEGAGFLWLTLSCGFLRNVGRYVVYHTTQVHVHVFADDGSILSPAISTARSSAATVFQTDGPELALPTTWEGICEWVVGRRVALWDEVFEQAFQQV